MIRLAIASTEAVPPRTYFLEALNNTMIIGTIRFVVIAIALGVLICYLWLWYKKK